MRLKYYLRGIGLGILFTVIILSISDGIHKDSQNTEQISSEINNTNHSNTILKNTETESIKLVDDSETEKEADIQINTETPVVPENTELLQENSQQTETQPSDSEVVEPQIITITVSQGEYCRPVAQKLQDAGLITDAEDFRLYMGSIGYASFIHSGEFQIPMGATYEEIANILIRK